MTSIAEEFQRQQNADLIASLSTKIAQLDSERTDLVRRLEQHKVANENALHELRQARNELFNYKQAVGDRLYEYVDDLNLDEEELSGIMAVFESLGLMDHFPKKDWAVEVTITEAKSYIVVSAATKELAMQLVRDDIGSHEVVSNIDSNFDWEVTDAELD